ncbi:N-acetylmuramoyl-L-alanine amidase, partial [Lacticaseibacillus rhamnosus MTCC 5462]
MTPDDAVYTPNSTVNFKAKGVDASGSSASLPASGLTWQLTDSRLGTIDANTGVFQSNGKPVMSQRNWWLMEVLGSATV